MSSGSRPFYNSLFFPFLGGGGLIQELRVHYPTLQIPKALQQIPFLCVAQCRQ